MLNCLLGTSLALIIKLLLFIINLLIIKLLLNYLIIKLNFELKLLICYQSEFGRFILCFWPNDVLKYY